MVVQISESGHYPLSKFDVFLNGAFVGSTTGGGTTFSFIPDSSGALRDVNELRVVAYDSVYNSNEASINVNITQ